MHFWHKHPIAAKEWLDSALTPERIQRLKLRSQTTGDGMRDYKTLKLFLESELNKLRKVKDELFG